MEINDQLSDGPLWLIRTSGAGLIFVAGCEPYEDEEQHSRSHVKPPFDPKALSIRRYILCLSLYLSTYTVSSANSRSCIMTSRNVIFNLRLFTGLPDSGNKEE